MRVKRHILSGGALCSLTLLSLTGCAVSQPNTFKNSFLSPSPAHQAATIVEPPRVAPNPYYMRELPLVITPATDVPRGLPAADLRLRRAEDRFTAGRKLHDAGDVEGARREFDRAVDILLSAPEGISDTPRFARELEDLVDQIYRYDVEGAGQADTQAFDKSPMDDIIEMTFPVDPNLKDKLREEMRATVSQLPLEVNDAVASYISYFSSPRGRATLISGLRRAGRYRDLVRRILDEEGLPQELIYLAQAESGFLPRAVSRKAATGMWQFIKARGKEYGLTQTPYFDDRLDPEKATRAAARHLRDLYTSFGDWYLALASYNCGPGCVDRAVQRTGYADFWELRKRNVLPKETANYVPIILATTIMVKNAADYGLEDIDPDPPLRYDTIEMSAQTSLDTIAVVTDSSLAEIRDLNPALLKSVAPAGYQLRVPKGTAGTVLASLEVVPQERRSTWKMHRVNEGETVELVARQYSTNAAAIFEVNGDFCQNLEAGDLLVIPVSAKSNRAVGRSSPARKVSATPKKKVARTTRPTSGLKKISALQKSSTRVSR